MNNKKERTVTDYYLKEIFCRIISKALQDNNLTHIYLNMVSLEDPCKACLCLHGDMTSEFLRLLHVPPLKLPCPPCMYTGYLWYTTSQVTFNIVINQWVINIIIHPAGEHLVCQKTSPVSQITKWYPRPTLPIFLLEIVWTRVILLHAHAQFVYYTCVKFHQYRFICQGGKALTRQMDIWMDRVIPEYPTIQLGFGYEQQLFALPNKYIFTFALQSLKHDFITKLISFSM